MKPLLTCSFANLSLCAQISFHFGCRHHIHYVLCSNVTFFGNSCKVEMDLLGQIIIKNGGIETAIVIEW